MTTQPACPECEKLLEAREKYHSEEIGQFLEWLRGSEYTICKFDVSYEIFFPVHTSIERLLAEYFKIDLDKVDKEREALLSWVREQQQA